MNRPHPVRPDRAASARASIANGELQGILLAAAAIVAAKFELLVQLPW